MFTSRSFLIIVLTIVLALALTACGGAATPQLIGSYPAGTAGGYTAPEYVAPPANLLVVYDAYIELQVWNTDAAAERAIQSAYNHGGYLASSQSWYQDGRKYATLTLAVPAAQFDAARQEILALGTLISETTSGELTNVGPGSNEWTTFSQITVQLRPAAPAISLSPIGPTGWNPARTFAEAFGVFASVFAFLIDVVIWVLVVLGPFALMGLGARAIVRRMRRP